MPIIHDIDFRAWEECSPESIRGDPVWRFHAYRVALYLLDKAERDAQELRARRVAPERCDQLLRAVGSISANVAEGFGRSRPTDRRRYFDIALGSLRESLTWYRSVRTEISEDVLADRFDQLCELRRILIGTQRWLASKPPESRLF